MNRKKEKSTAYIMGFLTVFFMGVFALIPAFCIGGDYKKGVLDSLKWLFIILFIIFLIVMAIYILLVT